MSGASSTQSYSWRRTWLIARREIRERMAQKAYRVVLAVGAVFVAALVIVPTLFDGGDDRPERTLVRAAFPAQAPAEARERAQALERAAAENGGVGLRVRVVSEAAARGAVRDGDGELALVVRGPADAPAVQVLQRSGSGVDPAEVAAAVQRATLRARLDDERPGAATRILAPVAVQPVILEGSGSSGAAAAVVAVMTLVLYIAGILLNTAFANGIVGDRAGRIVERLLTAVRPDEHLTGKLVGVGAAGLIQLGVWLVAGLAAALVVAGDLAETFDGVPVLLIVWFPIALVLTYVLYAALAAILVIPVRRIEDVAGALAVGSMFQVVAYIAVTTIVAPGSTISPLIVGMSLVPFFSPLIMLARIAAEDVAAWELVVGVLGPLLLAALLIRIAAPAYARHAIDAPGGKGVAAALRALRA